MVFLADKLVQGDKIVSPDARFDAALKRHARNSQACMNIGIRREATQRSIQRIEARTGRRLGDILVFQMSEETLSILREIDLGSWEGLPFDEVKARLPKAYDRRGRDPVQYRPPKGESFEDLRQRVIPFFEDLLGQARENILFVGHAGVNRVLLCHLLGLPPQHLFRIGQDPSGLSIVERKGAWWRVVLLNLVVEC